MRSSLLGARAHAVLVRTERRLVRFFFVLEEELRPVSAAACLVLTQAEFPCWE